VKCRISWESESLLVDSQPLDEYRYTFSPSFSIHNTPPLSESNVSATEIAVIFVSAGLAFAKFALEIIRNMERPYSIHSFLDAIKSLRQLETFIEVIMLGVIMAVVLKLWTSVLPHLQDTIATTDKRIERLERPLKDMLEAQEGDLLQEILRQAELADKSVNGIKDTTIRAIWSRQFEWASANFRDQLISIRSDKVRITKEVAQAFGEAVIVNAKSSIEATSYVDPAKWWTTPEGEVYLKKNGEAVQHGVRIRRIFVFRNETDRLALEQLAAQQQNIGIEVYLCDVNKLPRSLQKDVIIMDHKIAGELGLADDGDFNTVLVSKDSREVDDIFGGWNDLLRLSKRL
jgi:hypothetical protein